MKPIQLFANISLLAVAERKELEGEEHLVVPAIAIKEGVLNGIFYSANEIQEFAAAWDGVPIPVNHPKVGSEYISANSPTVQETQNIGVVYNTFYDESSTALKCEFWINIAKAEKLGHGEIIERLESGEMMEVSTGLFSNAIEGSGTYDGKDYTSTATKIRPDHIALLPDSLGAMTVEEGIGAMRTNKKDKQPDSIFKKFKAFIGLTSNEMSHDAVRSKLYTALIASQGENPYPRIIDVFDSNFVYEVDSKLYRQDYAIDMNAGGTLTLVGMRVEVFVEAEYQTVQVNNLTNTMKLKEKLVEALIANGATSFTSTDKEGLMGMSDDTLTALTANAEKPEEAPAATHPQSSALSDSDRALLDTLKANEESRVGKLRDQVTEALPHMTAEIVANMEAPALEALFSGVSTGTNFSAAGGAGTVTANEEEGEYEAPSVLLANDED